jgi:hypothetical protein
MQRDRSQCFIQVEAAVVDRMRAMRRPARATGMSSQARRTGGGAEVGMPKMTPAQIAETQRMAREWKRLGAPG